MEHFGDASTDPNLNDPYGEYQGSGIGFDGGVNIGCMNEIELEGNVHCRMCAMLKARVRTYSANTGCRKSGTTVSSIARHRNDRSSTPTTTRSARFAT